MLTAEFNVECKFLNALISAAQTKNSLGFTIPEQSCICSERVAMWFWYADYVTACIGCAKRAVRAAAQREPSRNSLTCEQQEKSAVPHLCGSCTVSRFRFHSCLVFDTYLVTLFSPLLLVEETACTPWCRTLTSRCSTQARLYSAGLTGKSVKLEMYDRLVKCLKSFLGEPKKKKKGEKLYFFCLHPTATRALWPHSPRCFSWCYHC